MERLLQYLDDLDDLYGMAGMIGERMRRFIYSVLIYSLVVAGAFTGMLLALAHQPIALATSILLFVTLLYRSVTSRTATRPHTA
jgi:phosphoglycerol transferase MdoB-like AlkP superfamily enzyme